MARLVTAIIASTVISLSVLAVAAPAKATTNFIYPTPAWRVSTQQGEDIGGGLYHMGVDVAYGLDAGTPIYAVADGTVKEAQERSQFGLVVLIEHSPDDSGKNVSLYGHLDPTQVMVTPGERVSAGDVIGVLGTEANNGGWTPHLHFGLHKEAYSGQWVYYGHVYDADTANDWYDPETYIPDHLIADDWDPSVSIDLADGDVVGNTIDLTGTIGDIGSGVEKVRIKGSSDGATYETLSLDENPSYELERSINISNFPDGNFYLKIIARDSFNRKTVATKQLTKDPYRYTTPAFVAMKGGSSDAFVTQWSFGGTALNAFFPFSDDWNKGGLLALGDLYDGNPTEVVALRNGKKNTTPLLKILSSSGDLRSSFSLPNITPRAITIGNGLIYVAQPLVGYTSSGELAWSSDAISDDRVITDLAVNAETLYVCWMSNAKTRISLINLATGDLEKTYRPLRKTAATGCQLSLGDFNGDGTEELAVGSNGEVAGTVKLLKKRGKAIGDGFRPFGDDFVGAVDVSALQWDTIEDSLTEDVLLVSQASAGQAWVKVYRLINASEVLATERVYEENFSDGARIVGWE